MNKLYLKFDGHAGFDDYFVPLENKEDTWSEILSVIEDILDNKYLDNDSKLLGLSLSFEIVNKIPDDLELD